MAYNLGIIIPARNEASRLGPTLTAIASARLTGVVVCRVIVALNATTDATRAVAEAAAASLALPLEVWDCPTVGKAATVVYAMTRLAESDPTLDGLLFMDADNATDLAEFARFDPLGSPGDMWIGSRHVPGAVITPLGDSTPIARRVLSAGMRLCTRLLLHLPEHDTQCGFKLLPRQVTLDLLPLVRSRSWVFDAEMLARAHRAGVEVHEVGIAWSERSGSAVRPIRDAIISLASLVQIAGWLLTERRARGSRAAANRS